MQLEHLCVTDRKALGAEVTGVCSSSKVDLVRSIGADHVIDCTKEDFAIEEHRYDLIFDIAGNGRSLIFAGRSPQREHL
jgi:NADPH:quinone reductase-like Zn-dependent oxidoreductase